MSRLHQNALMLALVVGGWLAAAPVNAEPATSAPADMASLPVNQWTKIPDTGGRGYTYSSMAYVPTRGQLLFWGAIDNHDRPGRNDVRAFDAATRQWVSDYPSDAAAKGAIIGGGAGSGLSYAGVGRMLPSGNPQAARFMNGVCWDSKRKVLVYTMNGLMASYDPQTKKWTDLKAKTVIYGRETPGGPPVYGVSIGYDPVNDEIIMFPYFSAKNTDLRAATGQISGHYGTLRYSYTDNTWRRVSDTFGSDDVKAARKAVVALMAKVSPALDTAWVVRRRPNPASQADAAKALSAAASEAASLRVPDPAKAAFATVPDLLKTAASSCAAGKLDETLTAGRDALWAMSEDLLDGALRVEPEPRCGTPLLYDAKTQSIVMFGGQNNLVRNDVSGGGKFSMALNDTWLYDCKTRQWREISTAHRPPRIGRVHMAADESSGQMLLADGSSLYGLDVAKGEWSLRANAAGKPPLDRAAALGFDSGHGLLVMANDGGHGQDTWVMKLDLAKLPPRALPAGEPAPPIRPCLAIPVADDPAWVAKLKELPVNTWVAAKPPSDTARRDWGTISYDPIRHCVVYFGGGHSTYQVNDVATYAVGANRWLHHVGGHNDFLPPTGWEGLCLSYRGGSNADHQRNTYQALDGRMYKFIASGSNWRIFMEPDHVRFYDIDRGGVWRDLPIGRIERAPGAPMDDVHNMFADPAGRILTIQHAAKKVFLRVYDIYTNEFTAKEIPAPFPPGWGESRPFCYMADRDQVFWMAWGGRIGTWIYDVKANAFKEVKPTNEFPAGPVPVVEYAQGLKHCLAHVGNAFYAYSLDKNTWAPIEIRGEPLQGGHGPYGQMVWAEKYGVFIYWSGRTLVMRPDFGQAKWDAPPAEAPKAK